MLPPMSGMTWGGSVTVPGHVAQAQRAHRQRDQHVAPHRFETVGIPLLRRRVIEPGMAQCREGRAVNRLVPKERYCQRHDVRWVGASLTRPTGNRECPTDR